MPTVKDVMTDRLVIEQATTTLKDAATRMRERDIGDVLVERDGDVCGIVTDRDIVVRGIAEGRDPGATSIGDICSEQLVSLRPDDDLEAAVKAMREKAIRRIPVMDDGRAVGIVSLGDLARALDERSALAEISDAPANE